MRWELSFSENRWQYFSWLLYARVFYKYEDSEYGYISGLLHVNSLNISSNSIPSFDCSAEQSKELLIISSCALLI